MQSQEGLTPKEIAFIEKEKLIFGSGMESHCKLILLAINQLSDLGIFSDTTTSRIALMTGMSTKTITRRIQWMRSKGVLTGNDDALEIDWAQFESCKKECYSPKKDSSQYLDYADSVFKRDSYRCVYCGSSMNLSIDHVTPQSKGGTHDVANLVTSCRKCNSSKGAKNLQVWLEKTGKQNNG